MSDQAMPISGSLRMREPAELAGDWQLELGNDSCTIRFDSTRIEGANGWQLADPSGCLARAVPGAVAWRPAPEGIELAAADRRTLIVLTATGDARAEGVLRDGRAVALRPLPRRR